MIEFLYTLKKVSVKQIYPKMHFDEYSGLFTQQIILQTAEKYSPKLFCHIIKQSTFVKVIAKVIE